MNPPKRPGEIDLRGEKEGGEVTLQSSSHPQAILSKSGGGGDTKTLLPREDTILPFTAFLVFSSSWKRRAESPEEHVGVRWWAKGRGEAGMRQG